jgi:hypothetical protein
MGARKMILNYLYDDDGDLFFHVTVNVYHYETVPPDYSNWESDYDYRGYTELAWEVDSFVVYDTDDRLIHVAELPMYVLDFIESYIYQDAADYAREVNHG